MPSASCSRRVVSKSAVVGYRQDEQIFIEVSKPECVVNPPSRGILSTAFGEGLCWRRWRTKRRRLSATVKLQRPAHTSAFHAGRYRAGLCVWFIQSAQLGRRDNCTCSVSLYYQNRLEIARCAPMDEPYAAPQV